MNCLNETFTTREKRYIMPHAEFDGTHYYYKSSDFLYTAAFSLYLDAHLCVYFIEFGSEILIVRYIR